MCPFPLYFPPENSLFETFFGSSRVFYEHFPDVPSRRPVGAAQLVVGDGHAAGTGHAEVGRVRRVRRPADGARAALAADAGNKGGGGRHCYVNTGVAICESLTQMLESTTIS